GRSCHAGCARLSRDQLPVGRAPKAVSLSSTTRMRGGSFIMSAPGQRLWYVLPDLSQQRARVIWFGDVGIASRRSCLAFIAAQSIGRDRDDWNCAQRRVGLDAARCLVAVEQRQLDVHQDQVRPFPSCNRQRFLPIFNFDDLVSRVRQQIPQNPPIVLLIRDPQDAFAKDAFSSCSTLTESLNIQFFLRGVEEAPPPPGTAGCGAPPAGGHAAAPPRSAINFRRLIGLSILPRL